MLRSLVMVSLVVACSTNTASVSLGQPFELAPGAEATVAETGLHIGFKRVLEDSRCPAQVTCIWAGRVTVELEAQAPNEAAETFALASCCAPTDPKQHLYAGQTIDLLGITPGGNYRVQLAVSDSKATPRPAP